MKLKLKVWRQNGPDEKGRLVDYVVDNADEDMSFLELIDVLNEKLILDGEDPADAAEAWLKENPAAFEPWLAGVTTFDGKPANEAVVEALGL